MSDLTTFRDHARAMAAAEHVSGCGDTTSDRWGWTRWVSPDPACDGCASDADRALWARLADEVDAYLGSVDEPLWGAS